jgi:ankyrin repeat protein
MLYAAPLSACSMLLRSLKSRDVNDMSVLYYASKTGCVFPIEALLKAGAKVSCADLEGQTPLYHDSIAGDITLAYLLANSGAKVSYVDL